MFESKLLDYSLTIIEDEQVALAGSIPGTVTNSTAIAGTVMMIIMVSVVLLLAFYLVRLHYYQMRLKMLSRENDISLGSYNHRSIRSVRNEIAVVEGDIAASSLDEVLN